MVGILPGTDAQGEMQKMTLVCVKKSTLWTLPVLAFAALCGPLGAGLMAGLMAGPALAQDPVQIATPAALAAALAEAQPGLVLELAAGDYGALALNGLEGTQEAPITLRSADPQARAVFSALMLQASSFVVLQDLSFDYTFAPEDEPNLRPFQIVGASDVTVRGNLFDGDIAVGGVDGDFPTAYGLTLRNVTGARIEANEIRGFYRGLIVSQSQDLEILTNDLHSLRMDGMNFAEVQRTRIEANHIHDFLRAPNSADHPDMIQFWTNRTRTPSTDIVIKDNLLNSGDGLWTQSIFMRNDMVDTGKAGAEMFYRNITIEGNVIINAHLHGITVGETDGLVIAGNSVLRNPRSEGAEDNPGLWTPQIRVAPTATDVRISQNVTSKISGYETQGDWDVSDNLLVQDRFARQPGYYDQVFVAARSGDPSNLASFAPLDGGPLDGTGIGAALLGGARTGLAGTQAASAVIRVTADSAQSNHYRFEARGSALPEGTALDQITLDWQFGDGETGTGFDVEHVYTDTGPYQVSVVMTLPDGTVIKAQTQVTIQGPEVLYFDPARGVITSFAERDPAEVPDLNLGSGPAILGQGVAPVYVPPAMIAPFFDAEDFRFVLRLRGVADYRAAGELMRIHQSLLVNITERGIIEAHLTTATSALIKVKTTPLKIFGQDWIDLVFAYSARTGNFVITANGKEIGRGVTAGLTRAQESWGLSLGNPFANRKSFDGELGGLSLYANEASFGTTPP